MPRFVYDASKPFAENKRLAIDYHSKDGPMISVNVGEGLDREHVTYLFPDGATLENVGGAFPSDVPDRPTSTNPAHWEVVAWRDCMRRKILYWSLRRDTARRRFDQLYKEQATSPTEDGVRELERLLTEQTLAAGWVARLEREQTPPVPVLVPLTPAQQAEVRRQMERSAALHARVARLPAPKVSDAAVVN
jgi:hypothetical protein